MTYVGPLIIEHDCLLYLYGAYAWHMPFFVVQESRAKRFRKQTELKPQEACRLGGAWRSALQLLQTLVFSELEADVVSLPIFRIQMNSFQAA